MKTAPVSRVRSTDQAKYDPVVSAVRPPLEAQAKFAVQANYQMAHYT